MMNVREQSLQSLSRIWGTLQGGLKGHTESEKLLKTTDMYSWDLIHIRCLSRKVPTPSDSEILRTSTYPKSHSPSTQIPAPDPAKGGRCLQQFSVKLEWWPLLLFFFFSPFSNIVRALIQCFEVLALSFQLFEGDHFSGESLKSSYNMKSLQFT